VNGPRADRRRRLEAAVGWRTWAATLAVFVAFLVVVLPAEAERTVDAAGTSETPDTSYRYSADDLRRLAGEYGEAGRAHYVRSRFTFDVVWPASYGAFLQASLLLASRRTALGRLPTPVIALPVWTVAADLLENTTAAIVMARYPDATPVLAHAAPVFTFMKWNLLAASFGLAALGALLGGIDRLRRRRAREAGPS
jgi:hypothetical protein